MAEAINQTKVFRLNSVSRGVLAACGASTMAVAAPAAFAQDALEEIVVTATKREEGIQDIPISVMVLGEQQLEDLNITDMGDYVAMLPNVSYVSLGPGSGNVYIRGISSGGESGIGANPSVAIYLDEQPVTAVVVDGEAGQLGGGVPGLEKAIVERPMDDVGVVRVEREGLLQVLRRDVVTPQGGIGDAEGVVVVGVDRTEGHCFLLGCGRPGELPLAAPDGRLSAEDLAGASSLGVLGQRALEVAQPPVVEVPHRQVRDRQLGMCICIVGQRVLDFANPVVEGFLRPCIECRKRSNNAGLALRNDQGGVGHDEHRRAN